MALSTRRELFEGILDALGEKITATATDTGTTTTFVSDRDLTFAENGLRGREVWYAEAQTASAANLYLRSFVELNSESARTITVTPAWPAAPQIGDVVILANDHGWSASIPEIQDEINNLIYKFREVMATEVAQETTSFSATTGKIALPDTWDWLIGAQWQDYAPRNRWTQIMPRWIDPYEDRWGATKYVGLNYPKAHLRPVRLIGAINLQALEDDEATTTIDYHWLRHQAAANLRRMTAIRWGDTPTAYTDSALLEAKAVEAMQAIGKRFTPIGKRWALTK